LGACSAPNAAEVAIGLIVAAIRRSGRCVSVAHRARAPVCALPRIVRVPLRESRPATGAERLTGLIARRPRRPRDGRGNAVWIARRTVDARSWERGCDERPACYRDRNAPRVSPWQGWSNGSGSGRMQGADGGQTDLRPSLDRHAEPATIPPREITAWRAKRCSAQGRLQRSGWRGTEEEWNESQAVAIGAGVDPGDKLQCAVGPGR
jgi:hypothetical protein